MDTADAVARYGEIAARAKDAIETVEEYAMHLEADDRAFLDGVVDTWNPYSAGRFLHDLYEDGRASGNEDLTVGWAAVQPDSDHDLDEREALIYATGAAYEADGVDRLLAEDALVDAVTDLA